ncbi:MAG: hypothetical protein ACN6QT_27405 [Burkholderia contaminans]|uniref:hypothetical protein n=1 Tax=Burkholderia TaxID=32008 RepID=UPI001486184A|nr:MULTISPECIES: hypothetical protein [Burkholderia]MCA7878091.1 hypothetical protein [Burkholderia contaminans]
MNAAGLEGDHAGARVMATKFRMVSGSRDRLPAASPSAGVEPPLPPECALNRRIAAAVTTKFDKSEQMGGVFPPTIRTYLAHSRTDAASVATSPASRCTRLPRTAAS